MNTTSPIRNFASLATVRAVTCLLFCWLGFILNVVALPPPVITAQPTNQTVQVGSNATFVVVATSGTPLTHQWHFQNVRIPGATNSSYTRTNAQLTHAGAYYVALTNSDGWAISSNAVLTVNNAPVLDNTKSPALLAQFENASAPSGAVGTLVSSLVDFASPSGQVDNVTDAGALLGIAVTAANTANGIWYYSTNNGAAWNALGAVSDSSVRLLAADANTRLYFKPNTNWNGTLATAITFRAWDQSSGKNGGTAITMVTNTVLDRFSIAAYSNNDGSANWSTNWVENDEVGSSPTGGNIRIVGGVLSFRPSASPQDLYRQVNLAGASSAILSGGYSNTLGAGDQIEVQVSNNGGENYTTLGTFNSGTNTGSGANSIDISAFIASNTRIRLADTAAGAKIAMTFDDVRISYAMPATGGATAFSTATDTASLTVLPVADVVTTKSGPASVFATSNFSYTITVTNLGPSTASNIVVSDTLPAGLPFVSASGGGTIVGGGLGQVVFDRASSNNVSGTLTWTHVTTNAASRLMLVGVSFGNSGSLDESAVTAVSYGGASLTKVRGITNRIVSSELWQLVNPPSGTNTVTLTYVGEPTTVVLGAATFTGVDQATPLSTVNAVTGPSSRNPSVTVSSATNEIVFDTMAAEKKDLPIAGAGQTQLWSLGSGNLQVGAASIKPGANSVTNSWTTPSSTEWTDIGASVKAASPGGAVVFDRASAIDSSTVLTLTHVTTNAANRLLLVGVSFGDNDTTTNSTVTALSYGGMNLTKVLARTNSVISSEVWLLVNPPSGTNIVAVTYTGTPTFVKAGVATFSGVDQITPLSAVNTASGKSRNVSITISSATNEIVFDTMVSAKHDLPIAAAGQTRLWSVEGNNESGGGSIKPGTNSVNLAWTVGDDFWADVAVSVKAVPLIGVVNWTIPTLANGATTNFTLTVTAPLGGTLSNNVSSTAATIDSNSTNNNGSAATARVITTVVPVADVVTIQSGPAVVAPLTNYTYTVTVSNQGPCTAGNVVASDTLSPMLTFVSASAGGTYLAGVVTWPAVASLANGATKSFTVTVTAPLSGLLTNTASSTAAASDPNAANNNGSAPAAQVVTVVSPLQTANTSKGASVSTLNWSHTVSPGSARILVVGVSIDAANSTINSATYANILPLTLLGQTNGTQSKVAMYYLINPPVGTYPVSINLSTASGIVGGAVSFNGVSQANPIAGFRANTGTGSNSSVTVASTLGGVVVDTVAPKSPQFATNSGPAQNLEWNLSAINYSGAGSTMPGAAAVSPFYTLSSAAAWAMAAVALNPATVLADVTVSASGPASVLATSNLTYTLTVTNLGNSSASNVVVSDVLPEGATFLSASSGGTFSGGVVTWPTLANFINGARTNYTVTITVPANGSLTNIVYSTAFTADPDPSNNNGAGPDNQVVTSVTPLADIATTVTGPATVFATANYSYVVAVTNRGPSTASDVLISDTLPAAVLFVSASGSGAHNAGVVSWSIPSLNSGAATNFTVTVTAPNSGTLTNSVLSTALSSDLNAANNDGSAPGARVVTSITPEADVATTVSGPTGVSAAANFSYLVSVTNRGPSTASNVVVSNTLPAAVLFVSASDSGSNNGGVVSWSIPGLDSGVATNFTVTVTAPANGSLINIVASTSGATDLVPSNNDGSAPEAQVITSVTEVADIATTVAGPAIAITNAPFSYTVTVTNLGPSVATSVEVSDTLPTGATFISASSGGTHNAGVVTWSLSSLSSGTATNFTVTVNAPLIGRLTNTVDSSAVTGDPDLSNNDGSAVTARVVTSVYPLLLLTGQRLSGANFQVEFHTHPSTIVSIQATTNLVDWATLITTNSGDGHVIFIDPNAANYPVRFYRSLQGP